MITITVELLNGVLRANSGEAVAGSANNTVAEWPPSPARLYAALVAGGGSQDNNRVGTDDDELRLLESAVAPLIAATGPDEVWTTSLQERYVVLDKSVDNRVHEYPARQSGLVRPGERSSPRSPYITYIWPELEPSQQQLNALKRRAARIPYLGSADSPVRVAVNRDVDRDGRQLWKPDVDGTLPVAVPYVGYLAALDRSYDAFRAGASPRGMKIPRARVSYRVPGQRPPSPEAPAMIWLVLDRGLPARRALAVGEALSGLVLNAYEEIFGDPPVVLHGHGIAKGEQHARYIALPDVGHKNAKGRILGACIWLPPGNHDEVWGNVRLAVQTSGGKLTLPGGTVRQIRLRAKGERRPWACNPARWTTPATDFATVFPAVHQRFGRIDDPVDVVGQWSRDAGLPTPLTVEISRAPFFAGLPQFSTNDVWRERSTAGYPYSHVRLSFPEPVSGPVVLGRGRSFGLGLMAPLRSRSVENQQAKTEADEMTGNNQGGDE